MVCEPNDTSTTIGFIHDKRLLANAGRSWTTPLQLKKSGQTEHRDHLKIHLRLRAGSASEHGTDGWNLGLTRENITLSRLREAQPSKLARIVL